jgi:hypothetical protein
MSDAPAAPRPRRNWLFLAPLGFFALLALLFLFRLFKRDNVVEYT